MYESQKSAKSEPTLSAHVMALSREAVERGGAHPDSAERAAQATSQRLKGEFGVRRLVYSDRRRVRAYFYTVLRNVVFERSRPGDRSYRERLKVASLIEDLRAMDASDAHIRQEVEAFFGSNALEFLRDAAAVS